MHWLFKIVPHQVTKLLLVIETLLTTESKINCKC